MTDLAQKQRSRCDFGWKAKKSEKKATRAEAAFQVRFWVPNGRARDLNTVAKP